jgi:hypothetical protein
MVKINEQQKEAILKRALNRGSTCLQTIADETGISIASLYACKKKAAIVEGMNRKTLFPKKTAQQKLQILAAYHRKPNDQERHEFLRANGILLKEIELWQSNPASLFAGELVPLRELKDSEKNVQALRKEIHRKDRALAEATALLILKKKFEALMGTAEEE